MAAEKRVVFRSAWLPYLLLAPQIAITIIFFFWPAAQAIWFSFLLQDAFGLKTEFIWLRNFTDLFRDSHYLASFKVTAVFSLLVATFGIVISLALGGFTDAEAPTPAVPSNLADAAQVAGMLGHLEQSLTHLGLSDVSLTQLPADIG